MADSKGRYRFANIPSSSQIHTSLPQFPRLRTVLRRALIALYALADIYNSLDVALAMERTIGACCAVICFKPSDHNFGVLPDATTDW